MAVTVGTLIVDLQANTASFVSGMDKAGQIALTSSKNIQKAFEAAMEGLTAAVLAAEAALAEMVDKSIENAARLEDMAQSTGVSTAALSGLEYAAKQSGVSTEALDRGLEKLAKSMLAAAEGTGKQGNAFKTLGVAVTDANGQLRPTQDVLADLAAKFASMPDGPLKTATAIQLFGKAGAELVPLLNRGKDGIDELMSEAKKLGVVIDDDTAAAAKKFEESMNKLKAAAEGAGNKLTAALLPQMQLVIDNITNGAEETNSRFASLLTAAAVIGKAFVVAFGAIQTFFDSLGSAIKHAGADIVILFSGLGDAAKAALAGKFKEAANDVAATNAALSDNARQSKDEQLKIWKDYGDGVVAFWNATVDKIQKKPVAQAAAPAPTNKAAESFEQRLQERIAQLQAAAIAEGKLANAIKATTDATIVATAAATAQKTIDDLNAQGKKVGVQVTEQQAAAIQKATLLLEAYKSALDANKQLEAQIVKTKEAITSTQELAAAYLQGAAAVEAAEEKAKLTPFAKQVDDLQNLITTLKSMGATDKDLAPLQTALTALKAKFADLQTAVHDEAVAQETLKFNETTNQMNIQIDSLKGYASAVMNGAAALRAFNIEQQVQAFQRANPLLDTAQLEAYRAEITKVQQAELQKSTAEKIASVANLGNIQDEINQLQKYAEQNQLNAQQQLALDALIHDAELKKQKDQDDLLLKVGNLQDGFTVFFDKFTHDGVSAAQKVFDAMNTFMNSFTDTLAKALSGQKASWSNFLQSIEEMILKLVISSAFKQLFSFIADSAGGGFGGFFSSVFGGIGSLFGGGRASGGPVNPGSIYEVGENGREWFVPQTPGMIVPAAAMNNASSNVAPVSVYQNFQVNTPTPDAFRASQDQITSAGLSSALRAARRNG